MCVGVREGDDDDAIDDDAIDDENNKKSVKKLLTILIIFSKIIIRDMGKNISLKLKTKRRKSI